MSSPVTPTHHKLEIVPREEALLREAWLEHAVEAVFRSVQRVDGEENDSSDASLEGFGPPPGRDDAHFLVPLVPLVLELFGEERPGDERLVRRVGERGSGQDGGEEEAEDARIRSCS